MNKENMGKIISILIMLILSSCTKTEKAIVKNDTVEVKSKAKEITIINPIDPFFNEPYIQEIKDTSKFYEVERHIIISGLDTLTLISEHVNNWNDPGNYLRIKLLSSNQDVLIDEFNSNGWVKFNNNYSVPEDLIKLNKIKSDKILVVEIDNKLYAFLFGWVYASEPGLTTIIDLSKNPRIVFNKNFEVKGLVDRNKDGNIDLTGNFDLEGSYYFDIANRKIEFIGL